MGIYDRDYYRREGPSYLGSFLERGRVCKWLIGINVVVFLVQFVTRVAIHAPNPFGENDGFSPILGYQDGAFTEALLLDPNAVLHGQVWRLLTYAFLHSTQGMPLHILFNMLFLWWFGTDVEDLYGPREFLAIYLLAGIAGGLLYTLTEVASPVPPSFRASALGASGAVTGILVLCAIHYPYRTINLMLLIPVPLWLFVVGSIALDAYTLIGSVHSGVAVACHLGGAAFAFGYYKLNVRVTHFLPDLRQWKQRRGSPRLRVYHEEEENAVQKPQPVSVATAPSLPASTSLDDEQLEAKMDAVLEKISRVGKDQLTESEKEVLLRASERLKKRRS